MGRTARKGQETGHLVLPLDFLSDQEHASQCLWASPTHLYIAAYVSTAAVILWMSLKWMRQGVFVWMSLCVCICPCSQCLLQCLVCSRYSANVFWIDECYKVETVSLYLDMHFALDHYDIKQVTSSLSSSFLICRIDNRPTRDDCEN